MNRLTPKRRNPAVGSGEVSGNLKGVRYDGNIFSTSTLSPQVFVGGTDAHGQKQ